MQGVPPLLFIPEPLGTGASPYTEQIGRLVHTGAMGCASSTKVAPSQGDGDCDEPGIWRSPIPQPKNRGAPKRQLNLGPMLPTLQKDLGLVVENAAPGKQTPYWVPGDMHLQYYDERSRRVRVADESDKVEVLFPPSLREGLRVRFSDDDEKTTAWGGALKVEFDPIQAAVGVQTRFNSLTTSTGGTLNVHAEYMLPTKAYQLRAKDTSDGHQLVEVPTEEAQGTMYIDTVFWGCHIKVHLNVVRGASKKSSGFGAGIKASPEASVSLGLQASREKTTPAVVGSVTIEGGGCSSRLKQNELTNLPVQEVLARIQHAVEGAQHDPKFWDLLGVGVANAREPLQDQVMSILNHSTMQQGMQATPDEKTRILIAGNTGTGKSSFACWCLGKLKFNVTTEEFEADDGGPKVGANAASVTQDVNRFPGNWEGDPNKGELEIVDTPGLDDPDPSRDEKHKASISRAMRGEGAVLRAICIVLNGNETRVTGSTLKMLQFIQEEFGSSVWHNIILVVNKWCPVLDTERAKNGAKTMEKYRAAVKAHLVQEMPACAPYIENVMERTFFAHTNYPRPEHVPPADRKDAEGLQDLMLGRLRIFRENVRSLKSLSISPLKVALQGLSEAVTAEQGSPEDKWKQVLELAKKPPISTEQEHCRDAACAIACAKQIELALDHEDQEAAIRIWQGVPPPWQRRVLDEALLARARLAAKTSVLQQASKKDHTADWRVLAKCVGLNVTALETFKELQQAHQVAMRSFENNLAVQVTSAFEQFIANWANKDDMLGAAAHKFKEDAEGRQNNLNNKFTFLTEIAKKANITKHITVMREYVEDKQLLNFQGSQVEFTVAFLKHAPDISKNIKLPVEKAEDNALFVLADGAGIELPGVKWTCQVCGNGGFPRRSAVAAHYREQCPLRVLTCRHKGCSHKGPLQSLHTHEKQCRERLVNVGHGPFQARGVHGLTVEKTKSHDITTLHGVEQMYHPKPALYTTGADVGAVFSFGISRAFQKRFHECCDKTEGSEGCKAKCGVCGGQLEHQGCIRKCSVCHKLDPSGHCQSWYECVDCNQVINGTICRAKVCTQCNNLQSKLPPTGICKKKIRYSECDEQQLQLIIEVPLPEDNGRVAEQV